MQNIKNLIGIFWALYVRIVRANFQASSFIGVRGEWGDGRMHDIKPDPYKKFLNSSLRLTLLISMF